MEPNEGYRRYLEQEGPSGHPVVVWKLAKEIQILRTILWLRHAPDHVLYGDDGEMQCNTCWIDFKRDPIECIEQVFNENALEAARKAFGKTFENAEEETERILGKAIDDVKGSLKEFRIALKNKLKGEKPK